MKGNDCSNHLRNQQFAHSLVVRIYNEGKTHALHWPHPRFRYLPYGRTVDKRLLSFGSIDHAINVPFASYAHFCQQSYSLSQALVLDE